MRKLKVNPHPRQYRNAPWQHGPLDGRGRSRWSLRSDDAPMYAENVRRHEYIDVDSINWDRLLDGDA